MKIFGKIIMWILLSIIIQTAGFLYLEKIYFKETKEITVEEVKEQVKSKDLNIDIPSYAEEIKVSSDAKYISYYDNNKLMTIYTATSVITKIETTDVAEVLYSDWVPKNNILIMAEKKYYQNGGQYINLATYNVRNNVKNEITEVCSYSEGMTVDKVVSSVQTGVTYISVSRGGYNSQIYRVEINNNLSKVTKVPAIGNMMAYQHMDILIYEDTLNSELYKYTNEKKSKIDTGQYENITLLGVTNDELLVLGVLADSKVTNIIYGKMDSDISTWTNYPLEKPKEKKDIHVDDNNSNIYVNDNLTGKVLDITNVNKISYEGKYIQITDRFIASLGDGKVYLKNLEEVDELDELDSTTTVNE